MWTTDVPAYCKPQGWRRVRVESSFRGDGHTQFQGATPDDARILSWVEFDWDGRATSSPRTGSRPSRSIRDWRLTNLDTGQVFPCEEPGREVAAQPTTASVSGNGFTIRHQHATNLVVPAPPLTAILGGTLSGNTMTLNLTDATMFPSHGYRIVRNGQTQAVRTAFNVSCVNPRGPVGFVNLLVLLPAVHAPARYTVDLTRPSAEQVAGCRGLL
nr:hypothetical protein GCM10020063_065660 [Dactylosporangium thailandense]